MARSGANFRASGCASACEVVSSPTHRIASKRRSDLQSGSRRKCADADCQECEEPNRARRRSLCSSRGDRDGRDGRVREAIQPGRDDQGRTDHEGRHESVLREDEGRSDGPGEEARGAELVYAAGKNSSDNASQIAAIENMVTAGVKGILITVADAKAENPAIAKARKAGVIVIALDSPTVPTDRHQRTVRHQQPQRRDPDRQIRGPRPRARR